MSYETRAGFRFVQPRNSWNDPEVYCFFGIDRPIHSAQTQRVMSDLEQDTISLKANRRKKAYKAAFKTRALWWDHFESLNHDGYGSFRLEFDTAIWELSDDELEACYQDIQDTICSTAFMCDIMSWIDMEEDLQYHIDEDTAETAMIRYVDLVLRTGYRADQGSVMDLFEDHLDPFIIGQHFLMRLLRGENVKCVDTSTPDPENTWDCFTTQEAVA
jgi:hypothetical protein